jgi:hypothetical protein
MSYFIIRNTPGCLALKKLNNRESFGGFLLKEQCQICCSRTEGAENINSTAGPTPCPTVKMDSSVIFRHAASLFSVYLLSLR